VITLRGIFLRDVFYSRLTQKRFGQDVLPCGTAARTSLFAEEPACSKSYYYVTLTNENYAQPDLPAGASEGLLRRFGAAGGRGITLLGRTPS
jgi:hypothetical protein